MVHRERSCPLIIDDPLFLSLSLTLGPATSDTGIPTAVLLYDNLIISNRRPSLGRESAGPNPPRDLR